MLNRTLAGSARALLLAAVAGLILLLPAADTFVAHAQGTGLTAQRSAKAPGQLLDPDPFDPPVLYPRSNYVWEYSSGPTYGQFDPHQPERVGIVRTDVGTFDLTRGTPAFPAELRTTLHVERTGAQYFVVVMDPSAYATGDFERARTLIAGEGGAIAQDLGRAAFIARLTPSAYSLLQAHPGMVALEPYHAAFKLSPTIGRAPLENVVDALSDVYKLDVLVFRDENPVLVAEAIKQLGGTILHVAPDVVRVALHRSRLAGVAQIEAVSKVFEYLTPRPHGEETTVVMQIGPYLSQGAGLPGRKPFHDLLVNGGGIVGTCSTTTSVRCQSAFDCPGVETCTGGGPAQVLMVLDSGIQLDAGDLSNTRTDPGTAGSAHRKVRHYASTASFNGGGDLLGCDAPAQGGFTHGQSVSAVAVGNATVVPTRYGAGFVKLDNNGRAWQFDGVAPRGLVVAYDASVTPLQGSCADPLNAGLNVGDIYAHPTEPSGSLCEGYHTHGARTVNFSWGTTNNPTYGVNAERADHWLNHSAHVSGMIFLSAGNDGRDANADGVPDPNSVSDPATAKNAIVVGGTGNGQEPFSGADEQDRFGLTSVGNTNCISTACTPTGITRIMPLLMAPGTDFGAFPNGNMGFDSEYGCRSNDNDQTGAVECDIMQGLSGTSFASPAAAGAAMLVRDYFAQGFYPDATSANPANVGDRVPDISGALVKAILIASADWLDAGSPTIPSNAPGGSLFQRYRFNNEQGYGRIQLNKALPLQNFAPPIGLIVHDGVLNPGSRRDISGLTGSISLPSGVENGSFRVCDDNQELRVALVWLDPTGANLVNDLNLELVSPSGKTYWGNYFTDDNNRNGSIDAGEDCPATAITGSTTNLDESPWSLPVCGNSVRDSRNPTEAIYLSPDARLDGRGPLLDADKQTESGNWTIRVRAASGTGSQKYAIAVSGGVCLGSAVQLNRVSYVCNSTAQVTVNELDEGTDPAPISVGEVGSRSRVEVVSVGPDGIFGTADDVIVDTEDSTSGLTFTAVGLNFTSNAMTMTDGTTPVPRNGVLDVRSGNVLRAVYADKTSGSPDSNKLRTAISNVNCQTNVQVGGIVFSQFGVNTNVLIDGGCERDARGLFTFGHPDRYMDAGERVNYRVAFQSTEQIELTDVRVSLSCEKVGGGACPMTIIDSPKSIGDLPAGQIATVAFSVQMDATIVGKVPVDMKIGVSARKSGKPAETFLTSRQVLNADQLNFYYSTDFPAGGTEIADVPPSSNSESYPISNEIVDGFLTSGVGPSGTPTLNAGDFGADYRFDSITYSPMVTATRNVGFQGPWNFETGKQGFSVVLNNTSTTGLVETVANWGEDQNGNGVLDYACSFSPGTSCPAVFPAAACGRCSTNTSIICSVGNVSVCPSPGTATCIADPTGLGTCVSAEDRDPANGVLDDNWSTRGGCGWQTNGTTNNPSLPGGIWHTGRIDITTTPCLVSGAASGACQNYEILTGTNNIKRQWEMLMTPIFQKVNVCTSIGGNCDAVDTATEKVFQVEFMNWAWNMAMDLKDRFAQIRIEFDTDTTSISPIDLVNDVTVLLVGQGAQGPIGGGNSPLFGGFQVFAPFSTYNPANPQPYTSGLTSVNGTVGNNRVGRNPCFFENEPAKVGPWHFAQPLDDDIDNDTDGLVDEFVRPNGPIRNMDITRINGPDVGSGIMRFTTLEDIYGPSGENFQGALGFRVFEGNATAGASQTSFGIAVDDMVVTWREYKLVEDQTNCATVGACASVVLDSSRVFEGNGLLGITVVDPSPYDPPTSNVNDCNGNGVFTDPGDTNDCDGNGTTDVVVRVTSVAEPAGELVVLNRVGATNTYRGTLPVSTATNVPGVLFLQQLGTGAPVVTVRYNDRNDGTGQVCKNDPDPTKWGIVLATASIFMDTANVTIKSFRVVDTNGDQDGYPDTGETVDLFLTVSNKTNRNFTNLVATLSTADSKIECVLTSISTLANLPPRGTAEMATPFRFKVHSTPVADRTLSGKTVNDDFAAAFAVTMSAAEFDTLVNPAQIVLDLDLNAQNPTPGATSSFIEGFEAAFGFGNFTFLNLDDSKAANSLSNGLRCQFNDPDFINSNSYGDTECYVGFVAGQSPVNAWHIHSTAMPDGGRAYLGTKSLHYGTHTPGNPNLDTTMLSQLDAIQTSSNVNLAARICQNDPAANKRHCNSASDCVAVGGGPCVSASPELSFKHQVSFADSRRTNTPAGHSVDRGVVHVRLGASTLWQKVYPFENVYDVQGTDVFSNCMFDPNDDGNDEDSYFDPTDPNRRLGPSSACFPELVFTYLGDTDAPFAIGNTGRASDGPGLAGNLGIGTWVESKFDLGRYRGRSVRVRFLFTSIKVSDLQTIQDAFMWNPTPDDDGWYVDDVRITQTLGSGVPTVSLDNAAPPAAGCGDPCTSLVAGLVANPAAPTAPGQLVLISAQTTAVDRCVNGTLLYQFWIDGDNNGTLGDPADTLLRDFTVSPAIQDAPLTTTRYGVRVKCSSGGLAACTGATTTTNVTVTCPGFGAYSASAWWTNVKFSNKTTLSWPNNGAQPVRTVRGNLLTLRSTGNFGGETCLGQTTGTTQTDATDPATGGAFYYLSRGVNCNDNTYRTFHPQENPTSPTKRDVQITVACP